MNKILISIFSIIFISGIIFPSVAMAGLGDPPSGFFTWENPFGKITTPEGQRDPDLIDMINRIIDWLVKIGIAAAIGFMAWGGFKFVSAAGNENKITEGKNIMKYSVLGLIVLIGANVIVDAIVDVIQGSETKESQLYNDFIKYLKYFYGIILSLSIVLFARGGLSYLTAKGDAQKISTARKSTLYGIIGIGIIIGVWFIVVFIGNLLGLKDVKELYPF